jgi:hypothetical protein
MVRYTEFKRFSLRTGDTVFVDRLYDRETRKHSFRVAIVGPNGLIADLHEPTSRKEAIEAACAIANRWA